MRSCVVRTLQLCSQLFLVGFSNLLLRNSFPAGDWLTGSLAPPTCRHPPTAANTGPTLQAGIVKRGAIAWQLHSCDSIAFLSTAPCAFACTTCTIIISPLSLWPQVGPEPETGQDERAHDASAQLSDLRGKIRRVGTGRFLPCLLLRASPRLSPQHRQMVIVSCQMRIGPEPWQCTTHRGISQRETAPGTHPLPQHNQQRGYCVSVGGGFSALGEGRVQSRRCVSVSQGSPQRAEPVSPTGKMEPYSINVFYHPHLRRRPPWLPSTHRDLTLLLHMPRYRDLQREQEACKTSGRPTWSHDRKYVKCDQSKMDAPVSPRQT